MKCTRAILIAILVAGFIIRLGYGVATGLNKPPVSDAKEFDLIAMNLLHGNGYRGISWGNPEEHLTAYRAPGLTATLVVWFRIFGHRHDVVRVANMLYDTGTALLLFLIASRLFSTHTGLIAAAVFAVWPVAIFHAVSLEAEPLFIVLEVASIWCCVRAHEKPTAGTFVLAGLFLGAATLTRANTLLLLPAIPVWAAIVYWRKWPAFARSLLVLIAAVAVIGPWTYRNYVVFGKFIPIVTLDGSNLLMGNNDIVLNDPKFQGREALEDKIPGFNEAVAGLGEVERNEKAKQIAVAWLKEHRADWPRLAWYKFRRFCLPTLEQPSLARKLAMMLSWGPVLLLAVPAFVVTLVQYVRDRHPGLMMHLLVLSGVAGMLVIYVIPRYRYTLEPFFIVLAAASVEFLWNKLRPSR